MLRVIRPSHMAIAAATALLALGSLVAPVAASGKTRWVDDDGHAGTAGCAAKATAYKTVQKAVTASGANDTVKVCPGTYPSDVLISGARDGLTLTSVTPLGATLAAADSSGAPTPMVVIDSVDNVTIDGFKLRSNTSGACHATTYGIEVSSSKGVLIHANDIRATGSHTGGPCGINDPIAVIAGSTGTVSGNTIKDWRDIAITVSNTLSSVTVKKNTLLFEQLHGGILSGAEGIWIGTDAKASVTANTITSPVSAGDTTPVLADGIDLHGPDPASLIGGNKVTNATVGVHATVASGVTIDGNTLKGGQVGIELSNADNATVTNNTTPGNLWGIDVSSLSTADSIHDNVFNGNTISDCTDDSISAQAAAPHWGTANSWTNDTGSVNVSPSHICAPGHG